jgi:hypothetical protein
MAHVISWRDAATFVHAPVKGHHYLARPVVVHELKFANVPVLLHELQELDNDLRRRSQQYLPLATLLSVTHGLESIVQDGDADHRGPAAGTCETNAA